MEDLNQLKLVLVKNKKTNCSSSPKWTRKMIINYLYF